MQSPNATSPSPVVSICCLTYNHERFIDKALGGFLGQQTDFPVEIIVHDDASTDRTADILRDFVNRHPERIRAVLRTENQHRQGRGIIPMFADWAKGEFIAVCEGDDFWTAPDKLQTQVEYMRANPDCVACCHDSSVVDATGTTVKESYFRPTERKFTQADVIGTLLSREPTCSLLFRRSAFVPPLPSWYLRRPSDLYLDILITEQGRLGFIDRNMAAYRVHAGGVWSSEREAARLVELIVRYRFLLSEASFRKRYHDLLQSKIAEFEAQLFTRADSRLEIARLEHIVQEQSGAVEASRLENKRLAQRERELQSELSQARDDAQRHIDSLRIQLDNLTGTSLEQSKHIAVLERERDRLSAEADVTKADAAAARMESQRHIDALKAQLERTVGDHERTIAGLLPQIAQTVQRYEAVLVPLREQLDQLASTSRQQAAHISVLEAERDRLTSEAAAANAAAANARAESQLHIDALKTQLDRTVAGYEKTIAGLLPQIAQTVQRYEAVLTPLREQLDQLASTSRQQAAHISVLEQERDRLLGREKQLGGENAHYLSVMEEQSRYIKMLEAERSRLTADSAKPQ